MNGDGFSDVIVGAPGFATDTGQAFLYLGSASGPSTSPALIAAPAGSADPRFGHTVATAGDVNGDGFSDVIIGGVNVAFVYLGCDDRQPLSV